MSASVASTARPVRLVSTIATRLVWLVPTASLFVIVAIFVPRFGVRSPSLIDDWFALTYTPTAFHQLLHGHYDAGVVDYGGRYRPTYELLSYAQWALGSRTSTLGPNLFGLARLLFFAGAVTAVTATMLRGITGRMWLIVAASITPAIVVATPGLSYNFVRFGVAEPTSFAAVALGLAAMTGAVRGVVRAPHDASLRRLVPMFIAGYAVYAFGAYMSEATAAVVVLLPALYYWVSREPGFVAGRKSGATLAGAAALIVLPIVHILWEIGRGEGGKTAGSLLGRLLDPAGATALGVVTTDVLVWPLLVVLALCISVRRALRRDRYAVLFTGMLVAGIAAAYLANLGTNGTYLSRYYLPLIVATTIVFMWLLQSVAAMSRATILASVLVVILSGRGDHAVRNWLYMDHAGATAIAFASETYATGCPVYLTNFPAERRMGLARMVDSRVQGHPGCHQANSTAFAIRWLDKSALDSPIYPQGCSTTWRMVHRQNSVELDRCDTFSHRPSVPTQDVLSETPQVVRFVPPTRWVDASALNRLAYVGP